MVELRIGKMGRQSAGLVLLLLCIFFIGGEGRPGIFSRSDVCSVEMMEPLSLRLRKILHDQPTPILTESKNEKVKETVKHAEQKKAEEEKKSIKETKEEEVAVRQEPKADRDQTKVDENDNAWLQETKEEMGQIKREEKNEPLLGEQFNVEEKDETWLQELNAEGEETLVAKQDTLKPDEELETESTMAAKVELKADEKRENHSKSDNWEQILVARVKDEERKEAKAEEKTVELRKQISVDEKEEEPKVEERREDLQVGKPDKPKVEEKKASMVEDLEEQPMKESVTKVEARVELKLGENDESKMKDNDEGANVEDEALKVEDKKMEKTEVSPLSEDKDDERRPSNSSEIDEDKPVEFGIHEDQHSDHDEDYPDFLDELRNFPERFQKTAESVKDHIRYSGLDRYSTHSKQLFIQANQQIQQSFTPLLGKDYAPFLAYFVSYGLLLLPLALVTHLLDRIRARYSLQKILLFVNIYLSTYFAALLGVTLVLGGEPLSFLMKYSSSSYIFLQLLQGFGYVMYLLLNTAELISTCSKGRMTDKFSSLLRWVVVVAVGFHYYVTVFHRAMVGKGPFTDWKMYGLYSIAFIFLCLFARIEWSKKNYFPLEVDDTTDKKN